MTAADSVLVGLDGVRSWQEDFYRDPVVLAAMIVVRLQTIVSRETPLGKPRSSLSAACRPVQKATSSPSTTQRVADAFTDFFGNRAQPMGQQTASEDFSDIPTAFGTPYTYWGIGRIDAEVYRRAAAAGRVDSDVPGNHSLDFAPVIQPTLHTGTQALVVAALAWLAWLAPKTAVRHSCSQESGSLRVPGGTGALRLK